MSNEELINVHMELSRRDCSNAERVQDRFCAENKANAVSIALRIVDELSRELMSGGDLFIDRGGYTQRIELKGLRR